MSQQPAPVPITPALVPNVPSPYVSTAAPPRSRATNSLWVSNEYINERLPWATLNELADVGHNPIFYIFVFFASSSSRFDELPIIYIHHP